jgi:hypothetical protein
VTPPRRRVSVEELREAAARAVADTSLRKVATAVDMSPTGLRSFLDGGDAYSATRRKLDQWYVRETAREWGASDETAAAALSILLQRVPDERAPALRKRILGILRDDFHARGEPPPGWLERALDEDENGAP